MPVWDACWGGGFVFPVLSIAGEERMPVRFGGGTPVEYAVPGIVEEFVYFPVFCDRFFGGRVGDGGRSVPFAVPQVSERGAKSSVACGVDFFSGGLVAFFPTVSAKALCRMEEDVHDCVQLFHSGGLLSEGKSYVVILVCGEVMW